MPEDRTCDACGEKLVGWVVEGASGTYGCVHPRRVWRSVCKCGASALVDVERCPHCARLEVVR